MLLGFLAFRLMIHIIDTTPSTNSQSLDTTDMQHVRIAGLVNEIMIATNVPMQSSSCVASFVLAWAKESSRIGRTEWSIIAS